MERYAEYILGLDVAAVVSSLIIFIFGNLTVESVFWVATELIFSLGVLSLAFTFLYFTRVGKSNWLLIPSLVILGIGVIITFFSWFIGGLVSLVSLLMLLFTKDLDYREIRSLVLSFVGFSILSIMPPLSVLFSFHFGILDEVVIAIGIVLIAVGIYLSLRTKKPAEAANVGFILLSLSFMFIAPAHELLNIHSNGSYGIYDMSIVFLSTLTFFIYFVNMLIAKIAEEKVYRDIEKGCKLLESGKYREAYEHLKRAYEVYPDDERVLNGMGIALMKMGKYNESEVYLRKLNRIKPGDKVYMTNLGNLYFRTGKMDEAMETYSKVLKKYPDYYNALNNLARCYMEKGAYEKARELLEKAIIIDEDKKAAKVNYYFLLTALGMSEEANKYKSQIGGLVE